MTRLILSVLPKPRRPISYVYPDVAIKQCVETMVEQDIGALVISDDYNVLGILSERDIIRHCVMPGLDINKTTAQEVCCANVTILKIEDTVEKAMQVITATKRRHVLVEEQGQVVAIVSIGDILFSLLEDNQRVIEQLENYIHTY